jgi:large exoprotein involved in heme utilization and adhesion
VTGTSISKLDGLITANGSANLFLINPNGIIFGPNASLDIGGSFVASTASSLLFGDGTQFSATNPQTPPLLTVSVPIGLQFGQTAMPIHVEGSNLEVPIGKTLALLGGDVVIKGDGTGTGYQLEASTGRIELGSVAANSLVSLTPIAQGWKLGYNGVQNFQDIKVFQKAVIDTSGNGSGAIQLRGRQIVITDGSEVGAANFADEEGQPLEINASESVEVSGDDTLLFTSTVSEKQGADIRIETRRLTVRDGAIIDASTFASGRAGNLTVNASESVEVVGSDGFPSLITSASYPAPLDGSSPGDGDGGTVHITTRKLILRDGGVIQAITTGSGKGGNVIVDASESVEVSGLQPDVLSGLSAATQGSAAGDGGNITINTQRLVVQGGARITTTAAEQSTGKGGNLSVNASDSVEVIGTGGIDDNGKPFPSRLRAESEGSSKAGNLTIDTEKLTVRDGHKSA